MNYYKQIFLGQDGTKFLQGLPDNFSVYFDWIILPIGNTLLIRKNSLIPKTIYLKLDYLNLFVSDILPKINNPFILVTGASDLSPQITFKQEFNKLIHDQRLIHWYMNNMRYKEEKISSLPCGIAAGKFWNGCSQKEIDDLILNARNELLNSEKIEDKVFSCFRPAYFNVCGNDMFIRPNISKIVNSNLDLFDSYSPDSFDFVNFVRTMGKYKYALCPHGNGMDPGPTAWIALAVGTIPVIYETPNVQDMFSGTDSVIYFKNFIEILDKNIYISQKNMFNWIY